MWGDRDGNGGRRPIHHPDPQADEAFIYACKGDAERWRKWRVASEATTAKMKAGAAEQAAAVEAATKEQVVATEAARGRTATAWSSFTGGARPADTDWDQAMLGLPVRADLARGVATENRASYGGRDGGGQFNIVGRQVDDQRPPDRTPRGTAVLRHPLESAVEAVAFNGCAPAQRLVQRRLVDRPGADARATRLPLRDHPVRDT
jgi:hypothetical protein